MYAQVEKPKENKNRAVANAVSQRKSNVKQGVGFLDNRPEAVAQRKFINALSFDNKRNTTTSNRVLIQRVPHFKIFESDGEKPMVGEGLTKLGVRRSELQIDSGDMVRGQIDDMPQGMSVSDSYGEEKSRKKGKNNEGIFRINSSQFNKHLKVRTDPEAGSHYLVGPRSKMKYERLHNMVGTSRNKWKKVGEVNASGEWEEVNNQSFDTGRDKRGEIRWKKTRKNKRFEQAQNMLGSENE